MAQRALRGVVRDAGADATHAQRAPPGPTSLAAPSAAEQAAAVTPKPWSDRKRAAGSSTSDAGLPFPFLPISAVALGRVPPNRGGGQLSGGDILEEALAEETLANEAARLVSVPGALDAAAAGYARQGKVLPQAATLGKGDGT